MHIILHPIISLHYFIKINFKNNFSQTKVNFKTL